MGYLLSGSKTRMMATWPRKKFDDNFSRLDTIDERDRQTDGKRLGDIKDHAYA